MKETQWLIGELRAAANEAARLPEWKRWGAETETKDTARSNEVIDLDVVGSASEKGLLA